MADAKSDGQAGLMAGFSAYYRPTVETQLAALRTGTIVFDTNALLDLYRFSPTSRRDLLAVISAVRDRVFVPYQVALEFHRNRVRAVADRALEFESQREQLAKLRQQCIGLTRQLGRRSQGHESVAESVLADIDKTFDAMQSYLDSVAGSFDLDPDRLAGSPPDEIVIELSEILTGKVGEQPSLECAAADTEEAKRRKAEKIPPGFKDDEPGDYLWWAEVLRRCAAERPEFLVVVSNDVAKGDWVYEERGLRIGPLPALVAEVRAASGAQFVSMTTSEFLRGVTEATGAAAISEQTLIEARDSPLLGAVVAAIRDKVAASDRPIVSSAAANVALRVDPSLTETAWAGAGSFRSFLSIHLPELRFVIPPPPGYVLDPSRHTEEDLKSVQPLERSVKQPEPAAFGLPDLLDEQRIGQLDVVSAWLRRSVVQDALQTQVAHLLRSPEFRDRLNELTLTEEQRQNLQHLIRRQLGLHSGELDQD